jgi:hypothetical protein
MNSLINEFYRLARESVNKWVMTEGDHMKALDRRELQGKQLAYADAAGKVQAAYMRLLKGRGGMA